MYKINYDNMRNIITVKIKKDFGVKQAEKRGVSKVIRIIPDPAKDIGFNIMSLFHYSHDVKIHTRKSVEEAREHLL